MAAPPSAEGGKPGSADTFAINTIAVTSYRLYRCASIITSHATFVVWVFYELDHFEFGNFEIGFILFQEKIHDNLYKVIIPDNNYVENEMVFQNCWEIYSNINNIVPNYY